MHIFFTSYARMDNLDAKLGEVVRRIESRVRALTGAANDIAFFDAHDLKTGSEWQARLGDALKDSKIIVCMCSPMYVNSEYCAKEFEVFRRRLAQASDPAKGRIAIVPVVWEPGSLPEAILRYQLTDARFPEPYGRTVGLSQFSRLKSQADKLDDAIEVIAQIINEAERDAELPPWTGDILFDALPSFLQHPNVDPYKNVTLTVLHHDAAQWKPVGPRRSFGSIADSVTADLHVTLEVIDASVPSLQQRLDDARAARHMSIVALPHENAGTAPWQQILVDVDAAQRPNCAVLLGVRPAALTSSADLGQMLRDVLPRSRTGPVHHRAFSLDDDKGCANVLKATIAALQMDLIAEDKARARQVESAELRATAERQGIAVDLRPTVSAANGGAS